MACEEQAQRDKIHVRDAELEPARDKGGDGKDDGEDFVDKAAPAKGEPDSEADERVGQDATGKGRCEIQPNLAVGYRYRSDPYAPRFLPPPVGVVNHGDDA